MKNARVEELGPRLVLAIVVAKGLDAASEALGCEAAELKNFAEQYPVVLAELQGFCNSNGSNPRVRPPGGISPESSALDFRRLITDPVHPAADSLPLWSAERIFAAAEDLKLVGKLVEPIERLKSSGEILDGRHRRILCHLAEIPPTYIDIVLPAGMTPEDYVEIRNVFRRQLTLDQLAALAALRYVEMREQGKLRRAAHLRGGQKSTEVEKVAKRGSSLALLSQRFGVNRRYIQDATSILELDPSLFEQLKMGAVTLVEARSKCGLWQARKKTELNVVPTDVKLGFTAASSDQSRLVSLAQEVVETLGKLPATERPHFARLLAIAQEVLNRNIGG